MCSYEHPRSMDSHKKSPFVTHGYILRGRMYAHAMRLTYTLIYPQAGPSSIYPQPSSWTSCMYAASSSRLLEFQSLHTPWRLIEENNCISNPAA